MGNHNGKDAHMPTGSSLDFFQTPPTTPSEGKLTALAVSTGISSNRVQAASLPPSTVSPITDWALKLPAPAEWAVISCDVSSESRDAAPRSRKGLGCLASLPSSRGSPSEQSWQERDSGLGSQTAAEASGDEMSLVFLSLMEHYRNSLGPTANTDVAAGAVELLRRLITERDELSEELLTLKDTLKAERSEWHQFQCDLQIAVTVANRLRVESEQALATCQQKHRGMEEQLARTQRDLEGLRVEHSDTCRRLIQLQRQTEEEEEEEETLKDSGEENTENLQLTGKGVAEGYIRSLAAHEKKREQREPRKTVTLPERSWSLSRIPTDAFTQRQNSLSSSSTLPLCKKEEPKRGRRSDPVLLRQDSWSSFSTGKPEQDQNFDSNKPQDGFNALLRRHGGSRRNSLLRWSQSRTEGYENIDVTNFSSSWEDGLAFCALFHSYVPEQVPYETLDPALKRENLDLALTTGESMGIPATLTAEEMLKPGGPDWQKVLDYVESIFRHLEV